MGPNAEIYRGTERFFEFVSDQWTCSKTCASTSTNTSRAATT